MSKCNHGNCYCCCSECWETQEERETRVSDWQERALATQKWFEENRDEMIARLKEIGEKHG